MKRVFVVLLLLVFSMGFAQTSVEELMAKGDEAYDQFNDAVALQNFEKVIAADDSNCDALWKASKAHVNIGEFADKKIQEVHYPAAEKLARKAVTMCPASADANLALAVAVGRLALMRGGKTKVELSKEVKLYAEKTLALNESEDIAHHILARWHREVVDLSGVLKMFAKILYGGLPDASKDKAFEHFKRAIELRPEYINHHLELAITYEGIKQWANARAEYEKVAQLAVIEPRDEKLKIQASESLQKIKNK